MKKRALFITTLLNLNLISAYIDPGTGGYLATSLFSTFLTYLAILFATVSIFFSNKIINPLKNFYNKNKPLIHILAIILIISLVIFFSPKKSVFDESLSGAHTYNQEKIHPGYTLYEGKLIDEKGKIVKKWDSKYLGAIDDNGDYYAQKYYHSDTWGRYTWNDQVIWEKDFPIHHEIALTPHNTIITFTKEVREYKGRKVEFDVILELDKKGNVIDRWSTWDNLNYLQEFHKKLILDKEPSFLVSEDNKLNNSIWGGEYDYYHLNALSIVPDNALKNTHKAFTPGNWIISMRHGSMLFILDKNTKEVLWRAIDNQIDGKLEGQHTPSMTENGNIIVFDNGRYRKWSRIISINPLTMNITWEYKDPENFYTLSQGQAQLLPNRNLLITESEKGHIFELTPNKEIIWEFYHPEIQDETNSESEEKFGLRQEIYRATKYDKQFIDQFLGYNYE